MRHFFLFLLAFGDALLQAQTLPNCPIPPELQSAYERDVKDLALQRIYQFNDPAQNQVIIPQSWQDTIMAGLAAIYNQPSLPGYEEVFHIYCIHQENPQVSRLKKNVYVNFNNTFAGAAAWPQLNILTGDPALDSFTTRYSFAVASVFQWLNTARLATPLDLNLWPLLDTMEQFPGVVFSEVVPGIGDANEIRYHTANGRQYFDFLAKWGDCPAICTSVRVWSYEVWPDCSVNFLGVTGAIPDSTGPMVVNCTFTTRQKEKPVFVAKIHPNPANTDEVVIELPGGYEGPLELEVVNALGTVVVRQSLGAGARLPVTVLPVGTYLIRGIVRDNGRFFTAKLIRV